ncbi:MAG TPA: hypothetical protein VFH39_04550 [Candidatus Saccharimonadales bacterium]|nr:hypothetical protein [Candidatus Saccharimonadales bacterium]
MRSVGTEKELRRQIARYLQAFHPEVVYRFDLAADMKLTKGQAARHKELHPHRGYPDLFLAHSTLQDGTVWPCAGLYLELKREGESPYLKDGKTLKADPHVREQAAMLDRLRDQGYYAEFAVGFEEAVGYIEAYLMPSDIAAMQESTVF